MTFGLIDVSLPNGKQWRLFSSCSSFIQDQPRTPPHRIVSSGVTFWSKRMEKCQLNIHLPKQMNAQISALFCRREKFLKRCVIIILMFVNGRKHIHAVIVLRNLIIAKKL
ncbi:hypothetical protein RclHR1_08600006 [Rhizophagus clarus]|uniref:Uncharacterized protein n=1 Tax=Rhizophagus clarus TaxID=94130 RepID=A0A2Z6S172_9GLOM|nr:hypothetical protein RclHR1_08600006 [Rhizophagus clarus]